MTSSGRPAHLRILMVSEDIPAATLGGLGKHVVRLGNYLISQGHTVDLMGWADVDYEPCRREVGFEGRYLPGFSFKGTNWKEHALGAFVPGKRSYRAQRIARAILRVAGDYDVVHYHGHYPMIGRYIPRNINFVQTRHDQGSECPVHVRFKQGQICTSDNPGDCASCTPHAKPGWWRIQVSAFAVRQYRSHTAESFARHKTIFVSEFLQGAFLRHVHEADSRNMHVVHNFIDQALLPEPQAGDPRHVLYVGRIDEAKGLMEFLDRLAEIPAHGLRIDIIGDGPHRAACEGRHAAPQVRFLGWKRPEDTYAAIASAGALVVTSLCEEAFGFTTLEGLLMNRHVYALERGATPELRQYEKWPGQLRLFKDMRELTQALAKEERKPPSNETTSVPEVDVDAQVNRILAIYRTPAA